MKLGSPALCDICGKARNGHADHTACSKKRQAQGFTKKVSERERLSNARRVAKAYAEGKAHFPD